VPFVAACLGVALLASLAAVPVLAKQTFLAQKMCATCHKAQMGTSAPVTDLYSKTKHSLAKGTDPRHSVNGEEGVGCQACHGPAKDKQPIDHAKEKNKDFQLTPTKLETRAQKFSVCVRCHAQYEEPFPEDYAIGDDILSKLTLKAPTGGLLEQFNEMQGSKHVTAEKGPTCVDCHTGHKDLKDDQPHQIRKPYQELCLPCHNSPDDKPYTHLKPVTIAEGATCVSCHMPGRKHIFKIAPAAPAG
jgi:hypothetical protein